MFSTRILRLTPPLRRAVSSQLMPLSITSFWRSNSTFSGIRIDTERASDGKRGDSWNNPVGEEMAKNPTYSTKEIWEARHAATQDQLRRSPPADAYSGSLHLEPLHEKYLSRVSTGRSVKVYNGEFADAHKKLETVLSRNKVRATVISQQRHEKKGVKRRKIRSITWRKYFAHQVKNYTCPSHFGTLITHQH